MGRRSLPKIDPVLDLSWHFVTPEQLPYPLTSATMFTRPAPLEIEVGSGKGLFLSAAASTEPDKNFLGIEIAPRYAKYASSRLARRQLTNARLIAGDAQRILHELVPADSVAAVHVYLPDPWWKARQRKRRVLNTHFLTQAQRILVPGGRLHVWTDVEEYFQNTLGLIAEVTNFSAPLPVVERPAAHDLDYHTHFERRTRLHGQPVYRAEFEKPSTLLSA